MFRCLSILLLVGVMSMTVHAESEIETIKSKLLEAFPTHIPDSIDKSPIDGIYEVIYGTQVVYVTKDGKHILEGVLLDIENGKKNLTAASENKARKKYLTEVEKQEPISFGSKKPKHTITVFTDIECGYCRKLHAEMDQYASYDIKINYLMFPRNGLTSVGYSKAVSVWCSDDREDALTRAKNGEEMEASNCDNPISAQYELGRKIGVSGTPAILTEDGELLPGYLPAKKMAKQLDALRAAHN